jgi:hypothetical protein
MIAFLLAMLAKPQAATLPLVILTIDRFLLDRPIRRSLKTIVPMLVLAVPFIVIAKLEQPAAIVEQVSIWQRPFVAGEALAFYLWKIVWPIKLGIDYGHSPAWVMSSGVGYFAWMIPVAIALLARHRSTLAGIAVFVAALVPVLGFVTFDFQEKSTVADHYLYLAMLGVAIAVAGGIDRAPRRALPIFIAIVALLTARSILQTRVWTNSRSLFSHALSVNPDSFVAYNNLYVIAMDEQAGVEAEQHARRMLAFKPDDMLSTTNLAGALAMQERFADAEKLYREAMQRWPDRVDPYIGLGLTLLDQDRPREALEAFDAAQRIAPENPQVVHLRANAQQQAIQR